MADAFHITKKPSPRIGQRHDDDISAHKSQSAKSAADQPKGLAISPRPTLPLPAELRQKIFNKLDGNDLFNASRVSRQFHADIWYSSQSRQALSRYELYNPSEVSKAKTLEQLDLLIPDTEFAKQMVEKYHKASGDDLVRFLKPFLDPQMRVLSLAKIGKATMLGRGNKLHTELSVAFREYISRDMNVNFLTGQECAVM